jgi:hypothetical protein
MAGQKTAQEQVHVSSIGGWQRDISNGADLVKTELKSEKSA